MFIKYTTGNSNGKVVPGLVAVDQIVQVYPLERSADNNGTVIALKRGGKIHCLETVEDIEAMLKAAGYMPKTAADFEAEAQTLASLEAELGIKTSKATPHKAPRPQRGDQT